MVTVVGALLQQDAYCLVCLVELPNVSLRPLHLVRVRVRVGIRVRVRVRARVRVRVRARVRARVRVGGGVACGEPPLRGASVRPFYGAGE